LRQSDSISIIKKYFPDINEAQTSQFEALKELYVEWNQKINVISRKDIDQFYTHHVLHSLAIAKFISFKPKSKILDVGTGGGFPGLPLAIYFKSCSFTLVDSIGKKIKVVNEISSSLNLNNIEAYHQRAEQNKGKYDFIISRAVTHLSKFCPWVINNISEENNHEIKNGIIYLKGGDLRDEINSISKKYNHTISPIPNFFKEPFFETKLVLHLFRNKVVIQN
jgi:16S rRNA (guanine527-N7)-methyltransferase